MENVRKMVKRSSFRSRSPVASNLAPEDGEHLMVSKKDRRKFSIKLLKTPKGVKKSASKSSVAPTVFDFMRQNDVDELRAFLESTKGFMHRRSRKIVDDLGFGLIHVATECNSLEMVRLLVEAGVDPNEAAKDSNVTPLVIAVCSGNPEISSFLISIQSVRESYKEYRVNFISSSAATDAVQGSVLNVRLSVQRKLHRHGQQFCKPMAMWEAAVFVGGILRDSGRPDPFRVAYLLQRTKCPGLAIQPMHLQTGKLPLKNMHGEYFQLLHGYSVEAIGLNGHDITASLKDLLWWQVNEYTGNLKPSTTLEQVKASLKSLLTISAEDKSVDLEISYLVQQVMNPSKEDELISTSKPEDRDAYTKRMISFKLFMLRMLKKETSRKLYNISFTSQLSRSSGVKLSMSALDCPHTTGTALDLSSAVDSGCLGGLCHCIVKYSPIAQVSSLPFWRELIDIFDCGAKCLEADGAVDIIDKVRKRKGAFSRAQASGAHTFEQATQVVEGLKAVEEFFADVLGKSSGSKGGTGTATSPVDHLGPLSSVG